jgi:hypothetical protein
MPHYKDIREARVGDSVQGVTNNLGGRTVVGTILSLTPGSESANCQVGFLDTVLAKEFTGWQAGALFRNQSGELYMLIPKVDYADIRNLQKIGAAVTQAPAMKAAGSAAKK